MNNHPVGVFDSGMGGLMIVHALKKKCPTLPVVYFGDTAYVPYGNQTLPMIYQRLKKIITFLHIQKKCHTIIIACFTASSMIDEAIDQYCQQHHILLLDMITPLAQRLKKKYFHQKIGMIGTTVTIQKNKLGQLLIDEKQSISIKAYAMPQLASMIEEGKYDYTLIIDQFKYLFLQNFDVLILGCTHYTIIKKMIQDIYPHHILIDGIDMVVEEYFSGRKNYNIKKEMNREIGYAWKDVYLFSRLTLHTVRYVSVILKDTRARRIVYCSCF